MEIIAFESHKRYTLARVEKADGQLLKEEKIMHCRDNIAAFLGKYEPDNCVVVETIGNWHWIVRKIERAEMLPKLV